MKKDHLNLVPPPESGGDIAANDPKRTFLTTKIAAAILMLVVPTLFFFVYLPRRVQPSEQLFYGWLLIIGFVVFIVFNEAQKNEEIRAWINRVRGNVEQHREGKPK